MLRIKYNVFPVFSYLQEKPKKKRQSTGKKAFTEPFVDKLGWHVEPPSLIWRWVWVCMCVLVEVGKAAAGG
jgi:hypothetical protein